MPLSPSKLDSSQRYGRLFAQNWERVFMVLLGLVLFFSVFQFHSPHIYEIDSYFHIKYADLLKKGWISEFPWLQYTVYRDAYADDHFLFHVLLIPFTFFDLTLGAKLAAILLPCIPATLFWFLLEENKVPYSILWLAGMLLSSYHFVERMCWTRPAALSLGFLLGAMWILQRKQYKWLIPLSFLYVWSYGGYPLILGLSLLYCVSFWAVEKKRNFTPFWYCLAGVALGSLFNPFFPNNILFNYHSYTKVELGNFPAHVQVGWEYYPYETTHVLASCAGVLAAFFLGIYTRFFSRERAGLNPLFYFLLSSLFLALFLKSRRFIEYLPPMVFLFAACSLKPYLDGFWGKAKRHWFLAAIACALILSHSYYTVVNIQERNENNPSNYQRFKGAMSWIKENVPEKEIIFAGFWDDFSAMFFFDVNHYYIVGLDPNYLLIHDSKLYEIWSRVVYGKEKDVGKTVKDNFNSRVIYFNKEDSKDFRQRLKNDKTLEQVFEDEYSEVYVYVDN